MANRSLSQEKLPDTDVTLIYLEKTLIEFSKQEDVRLLSWHSEPLEGGFTSKVVRVWLKWSKNNGQIPGQVVVKAASASSVDEIFDKIGHDKSDEQKSERRVMTSEQIARMINRTEYAAYKILSAAQGAVAIPQIYGCDPGLIVMEDMSIRAGICENLAIGLTLNQWRSVTLYLANLHAWSLTTDVEWRSKLLGPLQVADLFVCYVDIVRKGLKPTIEKYSDYYGHMAESVYEKEITYESFLRNIDMYKALIPEVMSHGDTWMNNIFFLKDQDQPEQLTDQVAAFVDWQVASLGCGLYDLVRVAIWSVKHELRAAHEQEIFKLYVDEFRRKAGSKLDGYSVYVENLQPIYDHMKAVFSLIGIPMTDFMLNSVAKVDQDPNGSRRSEILNRMKINYDFAHAYFTSRYEKGIIGF